MARTPGHIAYHAAMKRLKEEQPTRFAELYDEERERLGLPRLQDRRKERIAQMEREIARLRAQVDGVTWEE